MLLSNFLIFSPFQCQFSGTQYEQKRPLNLYHVSFSVWFIWIVHNIACVVACLYYSGGVIVVCIDIQMVTWRIWNQWKNNLYYYYFYFTIFVNMSTIYVQACLQVKPHVPLNFHHIFIDEWICRLSFQFNAVDGPHY